MPSATPTALPTVAEATSYVTSALDEWSHEIAIVQQDLSRIFQTLNRELVQETAYVQQQWDHLLGINPNVQNQAPAPAVPQSGNGSGSGMGRGNSTGSGSGSGATTTAHNDPNQQLNLAKQSAGHGSGSGSSATTTTHEKALRQEVDKAIPLSGSGSGTGSSYDTYFWAPHSGYQSGCGTGSMPLNNLANDPQNWIKDGNTRDQYGTVPGNQPTDSVVFDMTYIPPGVSPDITWNYGPSISTMEILDYTGQQTLNPGVSINLTGVDGGSNPQTALAAGGNANLAAVPPGNTSLSMYTNGALKLDFTSDTSRFVLHGFATITNMDLTGDSNATFELAGLDTTIASNAGEHANIGVQVVIDAGATLDDLGFNALTFTTTNLSIVVNGTMNVDAGTTPANTLIDGQGNANDYVNVNGGTLKYTGAAGTTDTFTVPVEVQGGGKFKVYAGKLIVQSAVGPTQGASVYLTGTNSAVFLKQSSTLECDNGYVQAGGTLATVDATTCALQLGQKNLGTADINGGTLAVNWVNSTTAQSSGELDVNGNLNFAGNFLVGIQGNLNNQQGLLKVTGAMNLLAGNSLSVSVIGPPNLNGTWTVINSGANIVQFAANNLPAGFTQKPNLPKQGNYTLNYPAIA